MSEPTFHSEARQKESIEISIGDVVLFLKKYLLLLVAITFVFGIIGYLISNLLPKQYLSQTILLPEQGPSTGGFFASLAVGGMSAEKIGAVRTDLYPSVLQSIPFALYMLGQPVTDRNNRTYKKLQDYLETESSASLFGSEPTKPVVEKPVKLANPKILSLSGTQMGNAGRVLQIVQTAIDSKTGVITIEAEMRDPVVAAFVVDAASTYLMNYVADYRTGKTAREVAFLQKRANEAKARQQKAEYALQNYRDRNINAYLNTARIEEQRLQSEYTLAQAVYGDLITRLEQSKIKVQEQQPIFKVLEPAKVPLTNSKPKKLFIAIGYALLGGLIGLLYIIFIKEKFHQRLFQ